MKFLEKFENLLQTEYIFHLHTNYTDGSSSIEEYCKWALENEFETIIFLEHVRRDLSYSFENFLNDIETAREKYPINILIGVEAKILLEGELDIPKEILPYIQVIGIAEHFFPKDLDLYRSSCFKVFSDRQWGNYIRVWVHPGNFLKKYNINNTEILDELISYALSCGIFIESNLKHKLPPINVCKKIPLNKLVKGIDAHSVNDLIQQYEYIKTPSLSIIIPTYNEEKNI